MQIRHTNRELYFKELSITSKDFILPYVSTKKNINKGSRVLAVGCGEGVSQSNRLVWFRVRKANNNGPCQNQWL